MRRIVADISDTHGGHKAGLLNPDTVLFDENERGDLVPWKPQLMHIQLYLWRCYLDDRDSVVKLAGDDEIILIHNGDLTQGVTYPEHLVSTRRYDQIEIAFNNLIPWLELPNVRTVRIVKGTGVHVLGEGSTEMIVARMLQERYKGKDIEALYHGLLDVDRVSIDAAHHGPFPGSRAWLKGNSARYYLRDLMMAEVMDGNAPPRVVLRAHYHDWIHEYLEVQGQGRTYASDLIITPSYCGVGDHARKSMRSINRQTHGMVALEIVDGELAGIHPFKRTLDLRTKERL